MGLSLNSYDCTERSKLRKQKLKTVCEGRWEEGGKKLEPFKLRLNASLLPPVRDKVQGVACGRTIQHYSTSHCYNLPHSLAFLWRVVAHTHAKQMNRHL